MARRKGPRLGRHGPNRGGGERAATVPELSILRDKMREQEGLSLRYNPHPLRTWRELRLEGCVESKLGEIRQARSAAAGIEIVANRL